MRTNSRYKSHKSSHSTKLRLLQNYVNAGMYIYISFDHYNITLAIPVHYFHFKPVSLTLGSRRKTFGLIWFAASKRSRNPDICMYIVTVSCYHFSQCSKDCIFRRRTGVLGNIIFSTRHFLLKHNLHSRNCQCF